MKILFITKEANNPTQNSGDFRKWWSEELYGIHAHRIGTWAYGLLNKFPPLDNLTNKLKHESLQKVAFINLKKTGGKSTSNKSEIIIYLEKNKEFLKEQINIINPNIIVGGISYSDVWEKLFDSDLKQDNKLLKYKNTTIIDFYHPSCRISNQKLYDSLKDKASKILK